MGERANTDTRPPFAARLQSMGLSVRETEAVLGWLGDQRSHGAVWRWNHRLADSDDQPTAQSRRLAVDETAVLIGGEGHWVYGAIDVDSKLLLDIELFSYRGTDSAAAFLHRLTEKHDLSETEFLFDGYGYLTALSRLRLNGHLDYNTRNHTEKWFHTLNMRTNRFHTSWVGSRPAVREWLQQFRRYYNPLRPHQTLSEQPPTKLI